MRRTLTWTVVILTPVIVIGALIGMNREVGSRNFEWPTQMQYSPAYRTHTSNPVLPFHITEQPPVPGTVSRGFRPFHYGTDLAESERAGKELVNPFQATPENLTRGQYVFANYCAVCHGATGAGDGPIVPKYPNPPTYQTEKSKVMPDGTMFHVITHGRNNMPSHAAQVSADDRWRAILYIRKLQGK